MAQASAQVKPTVNPDTLTDEEMQRLKAARDSSLPVQPPTATPTGSTDLDLVSRAGSSFLERGKEALQGYAGLGKNIYHLLAPSFRSGGSFLPTPESSEAAENIFLGIAQPMHDLKRQAATAWQEGRPVEAFTKGGLSNVPMLGPWAVDLAEKFGEGVPEGLGATGFDAAQLLAGGMAGRAARATGRGMKEWARTSMGRALDPTGGMSKYTAPQIIDNLLKAHKNFWSVKELESWAKSGMEEAMQQKAAARAGMPANASIRWGDVEGALDRKAAEYFTPIDKTPSGGAYTALPSDTQAIAQSTALKDKLSNSLAPSVTVPDLPVAFDLLEQFKQEWQNFAKRHGKFTGKRTYGMTPESSPIVEAADAASAAIRELLNQNAPKEWVNANRMFHDMKQIFDAAYERKLANVAFEAPESERMFGGLGAGGYVRGQAPSVLKGAEIRGLRRLRRSPGYQSSLGVFKDISGDILQNVGELDTANEALMLLQRGSPEGFKGNVNMQAAPSWMEQPAQPQGPQHLFWENGKWVVRTQPTEK